jgi:guanylate kinase
VTARFLGAPGALLVVISGPSGVGKDTVLATLKEHYGDGDRQFVVTVTTRKPRPNERQGIDYHFVDLARFAEMRDSGALLEWANNHGNWYGTPRDQVMNALGAGRDALCKLDVKGATAIRALAPSAVTIFVKPPSREILLARLLKRGADTPEEILRRTTDADMELAMEPFYDHVVINQEGAVEDTARQIERVIEQEHDEHPDRRVSL